MRNGSLDYFRLLAAFGIVLFHSGAPGASIGYTGLPYFLLMLPLFGLPASSGKPFKAFLANRANRLLVPWLIWSGIYGGLKVVEITLTGADLSSEFHWWMLITGPALHLWFLPFAFAVSLLFPVFEKTWNYASHLTQNAISALLLMGTLLMLMGQGNFNAAGPPLAQWAYATPAVLLGLFIGANWPMPDRRFLVAAICIITLGTTVFIFHAAGSLQLMIATVIVLVSLYLPLPGSMTANFCAGTALTVYLVHPLVMSALQRGVHLPSDSLTLAVCTIVISFMLVAIQALFVQWRLSGKIAAKQQ